ncbi:TIGR04279 domain-containing protein [Methanocella paludicola]|uniref:TIGR04279 domain-containing protein n=1 Tax=Methanocella paludicola TaxID=570267 RepID=UPI0013054016|nr:TIGR04279 domain-containing protein [Methanocella paludicola]
MNGVSDGTILYKVEIPDDAIDGTITGYSKWVSTLNDVANGEYTGKAYSPDSSIFIVPAEGNGPCSWISGVKEEIGDGDGHLENGETAAYRFTITDRDGISDFKLYYNGAEIQAADYSFDDEGSIMTGTAHVLITGKAGSNDLENILSIQATDGTGVTSEFSLPVYAPKYDYTAWTKGELSGWSLQAASFEPSSSLTDGGWIVLEGGNPISIPALEAHYKGPWKTINEGKFGVISNVPILGEFGLWGLGESGASVNVTPRTDVKVPMSTYPIYVENSANSASAIFYGTPEMGGGQQFHVVLVNTSKLASAASLSDIDDAIDQADISTDASGDFQITSASLPHLDGLKEGYYALLVLDYRMPNTPCLVAMAPIVVTKSEMTADLIDPATPMPGDQLLYSLNMVGDTRSGADYMYIAAMIPEKDYSGTFNMTSDGTATGTSFSFDGFTLRENISVSPDGSTIIVKGTNGTYYFDEDSAVNDLQQMLMSEFGRLNVSFANTSVTKLTSVELQLNTKATMPTGRYMLLTLALDQDTGKIAAINQTYVDLGQATYTYDLVKDWNLISIPLALQDNSISAVIPDDVRSNIVNIWAWDESAQNYMYYSPNPEPYFESHYPALTKLETGRAYWVEMNESGSFTITGTIPSTAPASPVPLVSGWSFVGPTGLTPSTPGALYPGNVVNVWAWDESAQNYMYYSPNPEPWFEAHYPPLTSINAGHGYWVEMPESIG